MDYLDGLGKAMRDGEAPPRVLPSRRQEPPALQAGRNQEELEERAHPWSWCLGWRTQPWNFDSLSPPTLILC